MWTKVLYLKSTEWGGYPLLSGSLIDTSVSALTLQKTLQGRTRIFWTEFFPDISSFYRYDKTIFKVCIICIMSVKICIFMQKSTFYIQKSDFVRDTLKIKAVKVNKYGTFGTYQYLLLFYKIGILPNWTYHTVFFKVLGM